MAELTYEDLENNGIDTSHIKVCKRIRNIAKLDRVTLDETEHRSALITFVQSLKLTIEQQDELKELLDKKYKVTSIRGIDLILDRVKENMSLDYINE